MMVEAAIRIWEEKTLGHRESGLGFDIGHHYRDHLAWDGSYGRSLVLLDELACV